MLSMPPDTTMLAEPALMMSCASMVAFIPEPQTLLMVVAPVASGSLAPRAACRAGAWPCPAGSTQPMNTSSTRSGDNLARSSAAPITWEPSLSALQEAGSPEYTDAEVDGLLKRQLFPLTEQGLLRAQRFRTAFEQGFDRALDRGIEAALRRHHVDQPPGQRGGCVDILGRHDEPAGAAP